MLWESHTKRQPSPRHRVYRDTREEDPRGRNTWKRNPSHQPREAADQGRKRDKAKLAFNRSQQKPPGAWTSPGLDRPATAPPWMPSPGRAGGHIPPALRNSTWAISLPACAQAFCPEPKPGQAQSKNLTIWTVTFNTMVFGRRAWCLAVGHANLTGACSAPCFTRMEKFCSNITWHG